MKDIKKMLTKSAPITDQKMVQPVRMKVEYGFHYIKGNRRPYFSITGEVKEGRSVTMSGCIHDYIERYFPELSPLIAWHLCDDDGLPMHYIENAIHWLEYVHNLNSYDYTIQNKTPKEVFEDHILFGHIVMDSKAMLAYFYEPLPTGLTKKDARALLRKKATTALKKRQKDLGINMRHIMERYGVEFINPTEYKGKAA